MTNTSDKMLGYLSGRSTHSPSKLPANSNPELSTTEPSESQVSEVLEPQTPNSPITNFRAAEPSSEAAKLFKEIKWAKSDGIFANPDWYPGPLAVWGGFGVFGNGFHFAG